MTASSPNTINDMPSINKEAHIVLYNLNRCPRQSLAKNMVGNGVEKSIVNTSASGMANNAT